MIVKNDDGHDVSKRFHDLDKNITRCEKETKNFKEERCVMIRKNIIEGLYSKHEKSCGERDKFTLLDFYNDHKL